jgi:hypothetical protein
VTLQQIEDIKRDEIVATDSQAIMYMINKHHYKPPKHAECMHKELLQGIIGILLTRAKADNHNTFINVKSLIGRQGKEVAGRLAGEAIDRTSYDQQVMMGTNGLKNMFWPT